MKKIALTCGDPSGVGPEIMEGLLREEGEEKGDLCLIGPASWLRRFQPEGEIAALTVGPENFSAIPGKPTLEGSLVAIEALEAAAAGCRENRFKAVVTGPVSKEFLREAGFRYPGHTEFFAARWGGEPTMAFAGGRLRVVLVTWHVPLREVVRHLSEKTLTAAVRNAHKLLIALGVETPRVGVCGLNPHAGEGGLMGSEERELLNPILDRLRTHYPLLSPCLPADTLFRRQLEGEFDGIVALYHDQGLAPLKALEFDEAVNITMGLPWVRTSPDHGTGFSVAGRGLARAGSLANAIRLARKLSAFSD